MEVLISALMMFSLATTPPKPPYALKVDKTFPHAVIARQEDKPLYTLTDAEINALSVKQKAKLIGISAKSFREMTKVVNHEAGAKMEDKILVAAVIFNRVHCKQFRNTIIKVLNEPGQFYDLKHTRAGSAKDKKAQLAIVIAYRRICKNEIPRDLLYFNSISYRIGNGNRYKAYKHYNNYFIRDTKCKCAWCGKDNK